MHAIVQLRNPYLSPNILYFEETYQVSIRKVAYSILITCNVFDFATPNIVKL